MPNGDASRRDLLALFLAPQRKWRVAFIGHTGRGNYGHDFDLSFRSVPNTEAVAVADPVESGREKAKGRAGAARAYADYREMLRQEKPDIVAICPRWLDQRVEMVQAVSAAGAHILMEKAFAGTLEEADPMMRAIGKRKLQLGHTARLAPATLAAMRLLREGAIGEILEMRARGKEDRRAGGEDLIVLGSHCLDLMRLIAGDPLRCTARVVGPKKQASEAVGPVAGDRITAMYEFPAGVMGYFASEKNSGPHSQRFGVTVYGSQGAIWLPLNQTPDSAWILRSASWKGEWVRIEEQGPRIATREEMNAVMARDLIAAIEGNREPACSARDGLWTVEMVQAVYASQAAGGAVELPLRERRHPLL